MNKNKNNIERSFDNFTIQFIVIYIISLVCSNKEQSFVQNWEFSLWFFAIS
jgi:hypothetical protein